MRLYMVIVRETHVVYVEAEEEAEACEKADEQMEEGNLRADTVVSCPRSET